MLASNESPHVSTLVVHIYWGATALPHQGCPVPIHDCQVVTATVSTLTIPLNVECIEFDRNEQSLVNMYRLHSIKVVRVAVRVVWRGDNACE